MERQELLCSVAVSLLAAGGPKALTHRAVDRAAGVPLGSTSNVFRTQEALVRAIVGFLLRLDHQWLERLHGEPPTTAEEIADALARFATAARTTGKEHALARHALLVHAPEASPSATALAAGRQQLAAWGAEALHNIGTTRPEEKSKLIIALIDGLISAMLYMGITFEEPALRSAINAIITDP